MTDEIRNRLWNVWNECETVMEVLYNCIEFGRFCDMVDESNFDEAVEAVKNRTWKDWSD